MTQSITSYFYFDAKKSRFLGVVSAVIDAILKKGAIVDNSIKIYSSEKGEFFGNIEEIKEFLGKYTGSIHFKLKDLNFSVDFNLQPDISISIRCPVYKASSVSDEKKVVIYRLYEIYVDLVCNIWDSIKDQKICGACDTDPYIEVFLQKVDFSKPLEPFCWLTFYGDAFVKKIGKEKLLTAPAYETQELKGGVIVRLTKLPISADLNQKLPDLRKHLGFNRTGELTKKK